MPEALTNAPTCSGSAVEIRGHTNTVTANGNRVFWHSGSPAMTDRGKDNIISQRERLVGSMAEMYFPA